MPSSKKNWPLKHKIVYVLDKIGGGNVIEIANEISKHEDIKNKVKLIRAVTMLASNMKGKGLLRATKEGNKNRYSNVV